MKTLKRIVIPNKPHIPNIGFNPAQITGNAAGYHAIKKGKGSKYNRANQKQSTQNLACVDFGFSFQNFIAKVLVNFNCE